MEEKFNYERFKAQPLSVEFGNFIQTSFFRKSEISPDNLKYILEKLADNISSACYLNGYKPNPELAEIIFKDGFGIAIGGKVTADLEATKDQFIQYASESINRLNQHLISLKGLSAGQMAKKILVKGLNEKYPFLSGEDPEKYDLVFKKIESLSKQIDEMVHDFEG